MTPIQPEAAAHAAGLAWADARRDAETKGGG